jgi:hypothetical protein
MRTSLVALVLGAALIGAGAGTAQARTHDWSTWRRVAGGHATSSIKVSGRVKGYARVGIDASGRPESYRGRWKIRCPDFRYVRPFHGGPNHHYERVHRIPRRSRSDWCTVVLSVKEGDPAGTAKASVYAK